MFIDSHCHINFPDLAVNIDQHLAKMAENKVTHALCVAVNLPELPSVLALADAHANIFASVGVHPDYEDTPDPSVEQLVELAKHKKVVAIGETGLDYYRLQGDLEWQRQRFRVHIRAAKIAGLPLIIHTRSSAIDTIRILKEEGAAEVGGVLHCFTESWEVAQAAMELGFYISFSGIVSFKKAIELHEVARLVPLDRMLIETDSPYLAPMPFRGKQNQPAWVRHVAEAIADLRGVSVNQIADASSANFFKLFHRANV
ncbi:TatD family hydrolase [Iodobacter ciconiae]|uniref:TatD family deoxyribonuclease n=1 Tax=Iodobacter ciconiae TaxID=2496266 RepID=A0A3S8ZWV6_9NEIS|nr:TatD family hydrolase [Iodobacter ciconiae]AZN37952.1 TatD family deoxyribonuclease [Iodobacter ciconiae]